MIKWFGKCAALCGMIAICAGAVLSFPPASPQTITLSPQQKAKLQAIQAQGMREINAVRMGLGTDAEKTKKITALAKKYQAASLAVLTPAQRAVADKQRAAAKARQERMIKVQKSLTPQQRTKISAIRSGYMAKVRALIADRKLTDAQKRTRAQALAVQTDQAMRKVFTPAQRAELQQ